MVLVGRLFCVLSVVFGLILTSHAQTRPDSQFEDDESPVASRATLLASAFIPYSGKVTRFDSGDVTFADRVLPTIGLEYRLRWERFEGWSVIPQFWMTPLSASLNDQAGSSRWISAALLVSRSKKEADFRLGGGWLLQWLKGAGGESIQQNGSSTQTYFLPDRSVFVRMLTLQAGFGYQNGSLRWSADVIGTGLLTSRRTANVLFGLGWSFL